MGGKMEKLVNLQSELLNFVKENIYELHPYLYEIFNELINTRFEDIVGSKLLKDFSEQYDKFQKVKFTVSEKKSGCNVIVFEETHLKVLMGLFYMQLLVTLNSGCDRASQWRLLNVCSKICSIVKAPKFLENLQLELDEITNALCKEKNNTEPQCYVYNPDSITSYTGNVEFREIPIDVLFFEGPIARSFLATLYSLKLKPRKIYKIILKNDIVTRAPVGGLLPSFIRKNYAEAIQRTKIHHWGKYLQQKEKKLFEAIRCEVVQKLEIPTECFTDAYSLSLLDKYSNNIEDIFVENINDDKMLNTLTKSSQKLFLFTGGGILSRKYFEVENLDILHIHPGYLPHVRGADCYIWSMLLRGKPSASCFIMDSGLDTGDLIHAMDTPTIKIPADTLNLSPEMLYRFIYLFIDPWIRAYVLKSVVTKTNYFSQIFALAQSQTKNKNFHFFHKKLVHKIVENYMT